MNKELFELVKILVSNIGQARESHKGDNLETMSFLSNQTCIGLEHLKNNWPNITKEAQEELTVIIDTLKTVYNEDEIIKYENNERFL